MSKSEQRQSSRPNGNVSYLSGLSVVCEAYGRQRQARNICWHTERAGGRLRRNVANTVARCGSLVCKGYAHLYGHRVVLKLSAKAWNSGSPLPDFVSRGFRQRPDWRLRRWTSHRTCRRPAPSMPDKQTRLIRTKSLGSTHCRRQVS